MRDRFAPSRFLLSTVALGLLVAAGCDDSDHVFEPPSVVVYGDGNLVEETRPISDFDSVDLQGVGVLLVHQGGHEELVVRAEANLMEYLETDVQGRELRIRKDAVALFNSRPIEYHLTVVDLERLTLSGAGEIQGSSLDTESLTVRLSGVGDVEFLGLNATVVDVGSSGVGDVVLSGSAQRQKIRLSGAGSYDGRGLDSNEADVTLDLGGSATVRVRDLLTATIRGSGSVYYIGDPVIESDVGGSGSVVKISG